MEENHDALEVRNQDDEQPEFHKNQKSLWETCLSFLLPCIFTNYDLNAKEVSVYRKIQHSYGQNFDNVNEDHVSHLKLLKSDLSELLKLENSEELTGEIWKKVGFQVNTYIIICKVE